MRSSLEQPLVYFDYIINNDSLTSLVEDQIYHSDIISYKYINSTNIEYVTQDDYGEFKKTEVHISFFVLPTLHREFRNTKNLLYNFAINNSTDVVKRHLVLQIRVIQNIINNRFDLINNFSFVLLPLRGVVNYVNNILLIDGMSPFELDENSLGNIEMYIKSNDFSTESKMTDEEVINSIFGYMNGLNEKRDQILNSEDYDLLITHINYFIATQSLPQITKKLHPNISNELLRFSFWVLHKEIYGTKVIKSNFIDFLKVVFDNFNNVEATSIRSVFAVKRFPKDTFLPQIIKKYF